MIDDWLRKGYVERMDLDHNEDKYFVPHFPILRMDKTSTNVRIVLDPKAEFGGAALNDYVLAGPKIGNDVDQSRRPSLGAY